jgi:hypothetical protein
VKTLTAAVVVAGSLWWAMPAGAHAVTPLPGVTEPTTVPPATTPPPAGNPAYPGWESQLLDGLHAPYSVSNYQVLAVWAQSEGVVDENNPLASSLRAPGATRCIAQCHQDSPVFAYDSITDGTAANVGFLYGSHYDGVRAAFQADAGAMAIWQAINGSSGAVAARPASTPSTSTGGQSPTPQHSYPQVIHSLWKTRK